MYSLCHAFSWEEIDKKSVKSWQFDFGVTAGFLLLSYLPRNIKQIFNLWHMSVNKPQV